MTSTVRAWFFAGAAILLATLAVVARVVLYLIGWVYDAYPLILLTLTAVVFIALAAVLTYRAFRVQHAPRPTGRSELLGLVTGLIAVITALYAAAQILLPTTPQSAAAAACRGAPTYGADAYGQTINLGVNARAGAGTGYPSKDRFGPNCTLGFDGFCIGEPIGQPGGPTQLPDQRWLIVHHRAELVSAEYIHLQSPQAALGSRPASKCSKYAGVAGPRSLSWTARDSGQNEVVLQGSAPGSILIGFAVEYSPEQAADGYPYVNVGYYSPAPRFVSTLDYARWNVLNTPPLLHGTSSIIGAAEACYADDAPVVRTAAYKRLSFKDGRLVAASNISRSAVRHPDTLDRQACSLV